jgi:hypothetical protein
MSVDATLWARDLLNRRLVPPIPGNVLAALARHTDADGHCSATVAQVERATCLETVEIREALEWLDHHRLVHLEPKWLINPDTRELEGRLADGIWLYVNATPAEAADGLSTWGEGQS